LSRACGCFRFWLDDDETPTDDAFEARVQAEHRRLCPDCREEMAGIVAQRALLRASFAARETAPLDPPSVARFVDAMTAAARALDRARRQPGDEDRATG
jgi:hypothetical protein